MQENLNEMLDDNADYMAYKKAKTIEKLQDRTHLTLEQLSKLASHPEHGAIIGTITLDELIQSKISTALREAGVGNDATDEDDEEVTPTTKAKATATKKKAAKATTKATTKVAAKKVTKTPAVKKPAVKKAAVAMPKKAASADGRKADFGKKKPRLDREQGFKEILAALKAAGGPAGRGDIESATGYTGVQVRTFCKELADQGKVKVLGNGGRSTKYALV